MRNREGRGGDTPLVLLPASLSPPAAANPIQCNLPNRSAPDFNDPPGFIETEDYVELHGERIEKPFVEKPASGERKSSGLRCWRLSTSRPLFFFFFF